ncbi:uncharacterized protein EI90DRAFT_3023601 [Cantharellus anzutake]|uniref:uncharacterized protein n=1 Tax=Cantharellus anzutake TaxID=1750568 RepID=UPI001906157B|nr:uncharacterized protein EI90DRAFT_3023601 [Cantharellus anzutake]KAF8311421.1 hypothetical protein EI90DRAFT_3023601 [Cantharellus anzutake]
MSVTSALPSSDGSRVASASDDKTARIWNRTLGKDSKSSKERRLSLAMMATISSSNAEANQDSSNENGTVCPQRTLNLYQSPTEVLALGSDTVVQNEKAQAMHFGPRRKMV